MKKLLPLILCLCLLTGCVSLPALLTEEEAPIIAIPTAAPRATAVPQATAAPQATEAPAAPAAPATQALEGSEAQAPAATAAPATAPAEQVYAGSCFRFRVPGDWLRADHENGVFFYPDANDTQHTLLCYQEVPNEMGLTESTMDLALMFSSKDTITAMVEGALASSGLTDFTLSPVTVKKTKLNGLTCYKGTSDITMKGETYDFTGYIFLRGDKLCLLLWAGDEDQHAQGLKTAFDSLESLS